MVTAVLLAPAARAGELHPAEAALQQRLAGACNFYDLRDAYLEYFASREEFGTDPEVESARRQFDRWREFMEPRVYPSGEFPRPGVVWDELQRWLAEHPPGSALGPGESSQLISGPWLPLGPRGPMTFPVVGRVNVLAFNPVTPTTIWAGTPAGGLWKSVDDGLSWTTTTDFYPNLGVGAVVISPADPAVMYMSTGDGVWPAGGSPYSYGVMKSLNGGATWAFTSSDLIDPTRFDNIIFDLALCPADPNVLVAAMNTGLWRTGNGGLTWTRVRSGIYHDLEIDASNPNRVFATSFKTVVRSEGTGCSSFGLAWTSWSTLPSPSVATRWTRLATTPLVPGRVYALHATDLLPTWTGHLFMSTDGAASWAPAVPTGIYHQGGLSIALAVSPVDANEVYVGGVNARKWNAGTALWTDVCFLHADQKHWLFQPGTGYLWGTNDGVIFRSVDGGASCEQRTRGLEITQFYRVGTSVTDPDLLLGGSQDNASFKRLPGGSWVSQSCCDGMEAVVDYTDSDIYYVSSQHGRIQRNVGGVWSDISPGCFPCPLSPFTTDYVLHPALPSILYHAGTQMWRSFDRGDTWATVSPTLGWLETLAVAPSNGDVVYAGGCGMLWRSTDATAPTPTWTALTYPPTSHCLTDLAFDPRNPLTVWATFSGYPPIGTSPRQRVYKSLDGGFTWADVSGGLPLVPTNTIVFERGGANGLYVGTEFGVYYRDDTMSDWLLVNWATLPNTVVNELEIDYDTCQLRAATFGRSMWSADLSPGAKWEQTYGTVRDDWSGSLRQTALGGFVIAGRSLSASGDNDVYMVKTLGDGTLEWERYHDGLSPGDSVWAEDVVEVPGVAYVLAGRRGAGTGSDALVMRTDSLGLSPVYATFGGALDDEARSIERTSDGGFIVAGATRSFGSGDWDVYLIKLRADFSWEWDFHYGTAAADEKGEGVVERPGGGYAVVGQTSDGANDVYVVEVSAGGSFITSHRFGSTTFDAGHAIARTADGGYVIAGGSYGSGASLQAPYLVRTNGAFTLLWERIHDTADDEALFAVQETSDRHIAASGIVVDASGVADGLVLRTAADGGLMCRKTYGGGGDETFNSLVQTTEGDFATVGYTESSGAGRQDVWLARSAWCDCK